MFPRRRPGAVGGPDGARMSAASRLTHGPAPALGGSAVALFEAGDVRGIRLVARAPRLQRSPAREFGASALG